MKFTLLTREDCGLCEEFEQALRCHRPDVAVQLADVDASEDWRRRWGLKIPVLLDERGHLVCATVFDPASVPGRSN